MNRRILQILLCALGGAALLLILAAALLSPNREGVARAGITLSHDSGFYDEPFDLELEGSGPIYYTLDATEPDVNSPRYEGPIRIEDASGNPNVYSMNTDVSLEFHTDILDQEGRGLHNRYQLPDAPVDKATVLRAVCIDEDGNRGDEICAVYFVDYRTKTGYQDLNIVSITTNPENLFDYEKGIYVLGTGFWDSLVDGRVTAKDSNYEFWPANYRQRGIDWEREAYVACFDAERNQTLSGKFGIRIQGRYTRGMLPKSLNVFARKQYGQKYIDAAPLFGVNWQLSSLNLNTGANGIRVKLHDYMINALIGDMDVATRDYRPCALFLDGEFWGVYWMTPRYEEEFFQNRYGVYGSDVISVKVGEVEIGRDEDIELYNDMVDEISSGDMSDPAQYARACELVDIDSCIDYYATEIYTVNTDWPHLNKALWRTRNVSDGEYADGRWRWIIFDMNCALNPDKLDYDMVQWAINRDTLFASLMDNEDFKKALYARLVDLAEDTFDPEKTDAFVLEYWMAMTDIMQKDYQRYYADTRGAGDFRDYCFEIAGFFRKRSADILERYGDYRE